MASKIKLGARPVSFKRTVEFPMLDGTKGSVEMTYRYRTRKEFGAFLDVVIEAAGSTQRPEDEKFSMAALMEKTADASADYILEAADGWNLEEPFTRENIQQLSDEIPAAITAIMDGYRLACTEGKLGN